jgi:hypothetical protein
MEKEKNKGEEIKKRVNLKSIESLILPQSGK